MTARPIEETIDLIDGTFYGGDPYPAFAWMRANEPVYHDERNEVWGLSRYEDVKDASKDPDTFSNAGGIRPDVGPLPMMIDMDAPEHRRRRRLVSAGFTPSAVREMEATIGEVCDAIIDRVCERGSCDFVRDIAAPLPLIVIGNMLGVAKEDRDDLLRWSDELMRGQGSQDPEVISRMTDAFVEYTQYIHKRIGERRETGDQSDLIGALVNATVEGDRLDDDSLVHESLLILIGGDETTRHVISGGMEALQRNPDQLAELKEDRRLLPTAVEEMLRWVTPIKNMCRTTTRDVEMHGRTIPKAQKVMLLYPSANRDEDAFESPETFDIHRDPNDHLAFGYGAHFCLGNRLARAELNVMFGHLLDRLPDLRLADESAVLPRRMANFVSGLEQMPVVFTPTPRNAS
ncbi:MAG TPA: cytochrome P450 [Acidimicrobiales bacterium]|nr:cytochrome P450 [Acidimicrobiales bacterium]